MGCGWSVSLLCARLSSPDLLWLCMAGWLGPPLECAVRVGCVLRLCVGCRAGGCVAGVCALLYGPLGMGRQCVRSVSVGLCVRTAESPRAVGLLGLCAICES